MKSMRNIKKYFVNLGVILIGFCLWTGVSTSPACAFQITQQNQQQIDEANQIKNSLNAWQIALNSHDVNKMTALYAPDALLYATYQNQIDTPAGIRAYFVKFMKHKKLKVIFKNQHIRLFTNVAIASGLDDFYYVQHHKLITIQARYTFVYAYNIKNGWQIVEHHSSVLPVLKKISS